MARKRRIFGPLTWSTLAFAAVFGSWSLWEIQKPKFQRWQSLRAITAALGSPDGGERGAARMALLEYPSEIARPRLEALLGDPRPAVRAEVLAGLAGSRDDPAGLGELLIASASKDPSPIVRAAAASALAEIAWPGRPGAASARAVATRSEGCRTLRTLLRHDPSPAVRASAAGSLRMAGPDRDSVDALHEALADPDRDVVVAAAITLLTIAGKDDPPANKALLGPVLDPGPRTDRLESTVRLLRADPASHDAAVLGLAKLLGSEDDAVTTDALRCLHHLGPRARAALPALRGLADAPDAQAAPLATEAILAILPEADPESIARLTRTATNPTLIIDRRMDAISRIRALDPSALRGLADSLVDRLADPDPRIRTEAHALLGSLVADTPASRRPAAKPDQR